MKLPQEKLFATFILAIRGFLSKNPAATQNNLNPSSRSIVANLLAVYALIFILADLIPHPSLKPGIISSTVTQIQEDF